MNIKKCFFILICFVSYMHGAGNLFDYVFSKYSVTINGRSCIFFPAKNPKKLIISFGSAGDHGRKFSMWSWFWNNNQKWNDTAYLFLRDPDLTWYLGNDEKGSFVPDYCNIINFFINKCGLKPRNVFTVGGSMGGYAAIYYATILKLRGAVAYTPQVDRDSNNRFAIDNAGKYWQDLHEVVESSPYVPLISLNIGMFIKDVCAAEKLIDVLKKRNVFFIFRKTNTEGHKGILKYITKPFIERDLRFLASETLL